MNKTTKPDFIKNFALFMLHIPKFITCLLSFMDGTESRCLKGFQLARATKTVDE